MSVDEVTSRDRTEFGSRLRVARKHAKLTQKELADRAGLTQSNIAFLETKGHASNQTVALAHACGVRAVWLARGEGSMEGPETTLEAAQAVVSESTPAHLPPNAARDYRTIAHTLAASLKQSGLELSTSQFLQLVDDVYRKLSPAQE